MNDAPNAGEIGAPTTYLIVLRHVLVAQDIAMAIAEHDREARLILARDAAEALPQLGGVGRLAMAFVGQDPLDFRESALGHAVAERGGRVVLMGQEAEAEGEAQGFAVLARPFTTGDVLQFLEG
jgi:hypothetical protein